MKTKKLIKFFKKVTIEGMEFDINDGTKHLLIKSLDNLSQNDLVLWLSEQMKILWLILEFKKISIEECRKFFEENQDFINNNIKSKLTTILSSTISKNI